MKRNRPLLLAAVAVLAACGDSTGPDVVQVTVSPTSASIVVGATQQFTATAKDASGNPVTGVTVTWASSDNGVASVSDAGLATGTGSGTAAITATISGVAGSSAVSVSAQQTCDNAQTVSLSIGGSAVYDAADCIILPSGAAGDRYRVGVTWPTEAEASSLVRQVQLSVTGLGVSAAPEAASPAPVVAPRSPIAGLSDEAFRKAMRISEATERFHLELRAREAELVRRIGTRGLLPARRPGGPTRAPQAASPAKLTIDTVTAGSCVTSAAAKTTAVLVHENQDLAVYQDSTQHASSTQSIDATLAQRLESYYTSYAKDMVASYWGEPSDIDGNGKIILFVSPVASDSIAAFVWAGDFFPRSSTDPQVQICPASNEAEIIYFNADLILDMVAADPGYQALATVAHEMKHVVGLYTIRIAGHEPVQPLVDRGGNGGDLRGDVVAHRLGGQRRTVSGRGGEPGVVPGLERNHRGELRRRDQPGARRLVPLQPAQRTRRHPERSGGWRLDLRVGVALPPVARRRLRQHEQDGAR